MRSVQRRIRKLHEAARREIMRQALGELPKEQQTVALAVLKEMDRDLPDKMDNATYAVVSEEYLAKLPDNQRIPAEKLLNRIEQLAKEWGVPFD